jgi:hypothetical protein
MEEEEMSNYDFAKGKPQLTEVMTIKINEATVAIVQSYLNYAGQIVRDALNKQSYSSMFKEIGDELIVKPDELIDFINQVQAALVSVSD